MGVNDALRELHYSDWKAREEEMRARQGEFWVPQVVQRLPDGTRVEVDKDNKVYFIRPNGARKRIKEL